MSQSTCSISSTDLRYAGSCTRRKSSRLSSMVQKERSLQAFGGISSFSVEVTLKSVSLSTALLEVSSGGSSFITSPLHAPFNFWYLSTAISTSWGVKDFEASNIISSSVILPTFIPFIYAAIKYLLCICCALMFWWSAIYWWSVYARWGALFPTGWYKVVLLIFLMQLSWCASKSDWCSNGNPVVFETWAEACPFISRQACWCIETPTCLFLSPGISAWIRWIALLNFVRCESCSNFRRTEFTSRDKYDAIAAHVSKFPTPNFVAL